MSYLERIRWSLVGKVGRIILWLWTRSCRMTVLGKDEYQKLRNQGCPVIFLVWHGRIFLVPYFFRKRGIRPLISPSQDGEIAARIMSGWGYHLIRGSSSHVIIKAWNQMKETLRQGGEVLIVPDGPRGPNRQLKLGGIKLAQETGAHLVPFTFSASKKKFLHSWDHFLMFPPFSKIVAIYGQPLVVSPSLKEDELDEERKRIQELMIALDQKADNYFA